MEKEILFLQICVAVWGVIIIILAILFAKFKEETREEFDEALDTIRSHYRGLNELRDHTGHLNRTLFYPDYFWKNSLSRSGEYVLKTEAKSFEKIEDYSKRTCYTSPDNYKRFKSQIDIWKKEVETKKNY